MKKHYLILFAAAISFAVFSCKDKEEDPPKNNNNNTKTASQYLMQQRWKITNVMSGSTDFWLLAEACNKDNQYQFGASDSCTIFDMTTKCNVSDADSTKSFYKLINNNTQMILNAKLSNSITINDTTDVVTLDDNTLKINAEYSGLPATITFKHP